VSGSWHLQQCQAQLSLDVEGYSAAVMGGLRQHMRLTCHTHPGRSSTNHVRAQVSVWLHTPPSDGGPTPTSPQVVALLAGAPSGHSLPPTALSYDAGSLPLGSSLAASTPFGSPPQPQGHAYEPGRYGPGRYELGQQGGGIGSGMIRGPQGETDAEPALLLPEYRCGGFRSSLDAPTAEMSEPHPTGGLDTSVRSGHQFSMGSLGSEVGAPAEQAAAANAAAAVVPMLPAAGGVQGAPAGQAHLLPKPPQAATASADGLAELPAPGAAASYKSASYRSAPGTPAARPEAPPMRQRIDTDEQLAAALATPAKLDAKPGPASQASAVSEPAASASEAASASSVPPMSGAASFWAPRSGAPGSTPAPPFPGAQLADVERHMATGRAAPQAPEPPLDAATAEIDAYHLGYRAAEAAMQQQLAAKQTELSNLQVSASISSCVRKCSNQRSILRCWVVSLRCCPCKALLHLHMWWFCPRLSPEAAAHQPACLSTRTGDAGRIHAGVGATAGVPDGAPGGNGEPVGALQVAHRTCNTQ